MPHSPHAGPTLLPLVPPQIAGLPNGTVLLEESFSSEEAALAPYTAGAASDWSVSGNQNDPFVISDPEQMPPRALRLTWSSIIAHNGALTYKVAQTLASGLDVSFRISIWKPSHMRGGLGNGMTFFLRSDDGSLDTGGGTGGAPLGYAASPGMSGALLGVGFDANGASNTAKSGGDRPCHRPSGWGTRL